MRTITRLLLAALLAATASAAEAGDLQTDGQLVTTRTDGPPLAVSSTDRVPGLNADTLDNVNFEGPHPYAPSPPNVIHVGTSAADFTSVKEAVDSITDASPSNQYLIRIGPGVFDDTSFGIALPGHIHLQGSGRDQTEIRAGLTIGGFTRVASLRVAGSPFAGSSAVFVDRFTKARLHGVHLTHESTGLEAIDSTVEMVDSSIAVAGNDDRPREGIFGRRSHFRLRSVTIDVMDSAANNEVTGIWLKCGASNTDCPEGSLQGTNLSIVASDGGGQTRGIALESPVSAWLVDSTIEAIPHETGGPAIGVDIIRPAGPTLIARTKVRTHTKGEDTVDSAISVAGTASEGSDIVIRNSFLEVLESAVDNPNIRTVNKSSTDANLAIYHSEVLGEPSLVTSSGGKVRVVHSHLDGGTVKGSGTTTCRWVTDETFGTFSTSCP